MEKEKEKNSKLEPSEKRILKDKYLSEGMSKRAGKKRLKFVLKNMVPINV